MSFTWEPLFHDYGLPLAVMGILVVFLALVLVVVFISVLPRLLVRFTNNPIRTAVSSRPHDDLLPEEVVAVIAAAASECLAEPHRIVHIRQLTAQEMGWSLEGRMQHHQSHALGRPDRRSSAKP